MENRVTPNIFNIVSKDLGAADLHVREGRFQRSLSFITAMSSILSGAEVMYEHYRGSYSQRVMYSPIILSPLLMLAGILAIFSRRAARTLLPISSAMTIVDGIVGFAFHVRGIKRKPGGWRNPVANIIMGPPIFAPLLFTTSGFLGVIASLLRREDDPEHDLLPGIRRPAPAWTHLLPQGITSEGITIGQDVREGRFQQGLAIATAVSALFSGIEALYSHYKNNFKYAGLQWSPIVLTPILMAGGIGAVWSRTVARTLLPIASLIALIDGGVGTFFHVRGVGRRPGGFRVPVHNIIYGPPVFAPLLFASSGFLGLLASLLRREQ
jgi:phosphate/sulfate permease